MPQMAPLSWLSLYIIFSSVLMMFCIMNYYMFIISPEKSASNKLKSPHSFYWKW
uniref:ATP synthase complex subunit 8 n=1 Tax=Micromorphus albipes TaxID=1000630 RepID=A0A7D6W459_9MUSC|nr:ATP synthase F0 subunit 8 [Micromorphus albipes]